MPGLGARASEPQQGLITWWRSCENLLRGMLLHVSHSLFTGEVTSPPARKSEPTFGVIFSGLHRCVLVSHMAYLFHVLYALHVMKGIMLVIRLQARYWWQHMGCAC